MSLLCPCCSSSIFSLCCEPFIVGDLIPETAEQLMRSRYTACTKGDIDYLVDTTHSSTRSRFSRNEIEHWSLSNQWIQLEILFVSENTVEFKAHYREEGSFPSIHHEKSRFIREAEKWYYIDGSVI